jgi:hypothetical protein
VQPIHHGSRRADRHRGLADDQARPRELGRERVECRLHRGEVGRVATRALRRSYADEVHLGVRRHCKVRVEAQCAGVEARPEQSIEPGLVKGRDAA